MAKWLGMISLGIALAGGSAPWPRDYDVVIDPAFDQEQESAITQAVTEWQTAIGLQGALHVHIAMCDEPIDGGATRLCMAPTDSLGADWGFTVYSPNGSQTWIRRDAHGAWLYVGAAHELGHAMGLVHTGPGTLMCANSGCSAIVVTAADVEQWQSLRQ